LETEEKKTRRLAKFNFLPKIKFKGSRLALVLGGFVLAVFIILGVFAVGIYKFEWTDKVTLKVASIIPYPAFFVNGKPVSYAKYEQYLKTYTTYTKEFYIKEEQKIDVDSKEAQDILSDSKQKIKDLLIRNTIVRDEISKRKIKYNVQEVNDSFNEFIKNTGGEEEVQNNLNKYYGISLTEFRSSFFMDAFLSGKLQNIIAEDKELNEDAEKRAQSVLEEIRKGADFAETAKKHSEDTETASQGGDLGFIAKGMMVPEFEDAAYKLSVDQVSDPIKTVYGYHILKVTEVDGEERKVSHILIQARDFEWWLSDQTQKVKTSFWVE